MPKNNYILINRCIQSNWLWEEKPFSKGQAWIDLLLLASWKDSKQIYKGKLEDFKRGDVCASYVYLADRWGWSRQKVARFMAVLESDNMVKTNVTTHRTVITIENYGVYQCQDQDMEQPHGQQVDSKRTSSGHNRIREKKENKENILYGEFKNVQLSDEEYSKLQEYEPYKEFIERLSGYMQSTGKKYKSHYATILNWMRKDGVTKKSNHSNKDVYRNNEQKALDQWYEQQMKEMGVKTHDEVDRILADRRKNVDLNAVMKGMFK